MLSVVRGTMAFGAEATLDKGVASLHHALRTGQDRAC